MKRSFIIGAAAAVALFAAAPSYAGFGWNGVNLNGLGYNGLGYNGMKPNGLGYNGMKPNGLGYNGLGYNTNQAAAAGQPGLNLTFDGVTLATGETLAAK